MVGRSRSSIPGATFSVRSLLAVLPLQQQTRRRFRSLNLSLARTGAGRAGLRRLLVTRLRGSPRPARSNGDTIFQRLAFSGAKVALRSLRGPPPLLYEAHRRNIASI